ncbi:MAG: hypothetical protein JNK74_15920 [Candidatus Hydrogenedentes bacterium]|nr:hypothetical protein [Candidatus Hydrogenedentota bacterium]
MSKSDATSVVQSIERQLDRYLTSGDHTERLAALVEGLPALINMMPRMPLDQPELDARREVLHQCVNAFMTDTSSTSGQAPNRRRILEAAVNGKVDALLSWNSTINVNAAESARSRLLGEVTQISKNEFLLSSLTYRLDKADIGSHVGDTADQAKEWVCTLWNEVCVKSRTGDEPITDMLSFEFVHKTTQILVQADAGLGTVLSAALRDSIVKSLNSDKLAFYEIRANQTSESKILDFFGPHLEEAEQWNLILSIINAELNTNLQKGGRPE